MHRAQGEKKQLLLRRNGLTFFLMLRYHDGRKVWTNIRLILLAASADRLRHAKRYTKSLTPNFALAFESLMPQHVTVCLLSSFACMLLLRMYKLDNAS